MSRFLVFLVAAAFLIGVQSASAAKLAPQKNTLQPIPADVQPALSQSIQRTATQADIQTIQNAQTTDQAQRSDQQTTNTSLPTTPYAPSTSSNSIALWIAIVVVLLIVGGASWLWRSF